MPLQPVWPPSAASPVANQQTGSRGLGLLSGSCGAQLFCAGACRALLDASQKVSKPGMIAQPVETWVGPDPDQVGIAVVERPLQPHQRLLIFSETGIHQRGDIR